MSGYYRLYRHPNGYYYHRVRVPADISETLGKTLELRSLHTRELREALRRLPAVIVEVDSLFASLRAQRKGASRGSASTVNRKPLSPKFVMRNALIEFVETRRAEEFAYRAAIFEEASERSVGCDQLPLSTQKVSYEAVTAAVALSQKQRLAGQLERTKLARAAGDLGRWLAIADNLASALNARQRLTLAFALIDAEIDNLQLWIDEAHCAAPPVSLAQKVIKNTEKPDKLADLPLMSVIAAECFTSIGKEKNWSPKTATARSLQIKQVIAVCGDKPLNQYNQNDIRQLKRTLFSLPPRSQSKKSFDSLTKAQLAERSRTEGLGGLSVESVRQIMTAANLVFGWARAEYDANLKNIVQPMIPTPSSSGDRLQKRCCLTVPELEALFHLPVFTGVLSEEEWLKLGDFSMHHTGRFWVPLLSIFAGTRLMEAVQLCREDIRCEDGIWIIDLNERQDGKRLKNIYSARLIPIHPELIRLGFLAFVQAAAPGQRLFGDIRLGPDSQRHRHASKLFNGLLASAGIKDRKKVWHSLRHSFEQACRDSRVDSAIMDQLQGHSQRGMRAVYGDRYGLPALADGVNSICYHGLDLSHIRIFPN